MAEWQDQTSYSQGERGKVDPRTWGLQVGEITLVVTYFVGFGKEWTTHTSSSDLIPSMRALGTEDLEEAKAKAIALCATEAQQRLAQYTELVATLGKMQADV